MKTFCFQGEIPASKSLLNRALILQSHCRQIEIEGDSDCDDVRHMKNALKDFGQRNEIYCGEAGTVIRFMGLRAAREPGAFKLTGSARLLRRPQQEMLSILDQLSVSCSLHPDHVLIQGQGWKKPRSPLQVHRETSSQFATGLLLNCWDLPFDLEFEMKPGVSQGYWDMSVEMAQQVGMTIERNGDRWLIPAQQRPKAQQLIMEPDYSSAFALAAAGALAGECEITNATEKSWQPDFRFISLMRQMQVPVQVKGKHLLFRKSSRLRPLDVGLKTSPDLFPVLSVLCAFAEGESFLSDAPHLALKESNRIEKTAELLQRAGFDCTVGSDGMRIQGKGPNPRTVGFDFDPDEDHRMAMAAGLLKLMGFSIRIRHPQVVSKSFPGFWAALGVQP